MKIFLALIIDKSIFPLFRSRCKDTEEVILKEIQNCTKNVNTSIIEQTAYLRASANKKNLDLAKYKEEIKWEMAEDRWNSR